MTDTIDTLFGQLSREHGPDAAAKGLDFVRATMRDVQRVTGADRAKMVSAFDAEFFDFLVAAWHETCFGTKELMDDTDDALCRVNIKVIAAKCKMPKAKVRGVLSREAMARFGEVSA